MSGEQLLIDEKLRERFVRSIKAGDPGAAASFDPSSITNPASWDAGSMCFDLPAGHVVCGIVVEPTKSPNTRGVRFVIRRIDYCPEPH